jgi:hypothetical protein
MANIYVKIKKKKKKLFFIRIIFLLNLIYINSTRIQYI